MAPKIYNPNDLGPVARLAIERRQFKQLLPHMHAQYLRWQLECDYIFGDSPEDVVRVTNELTFKRHNAETEVWKSLAQAYPRPLTRKDWACLITTDIKPTPDLRMTNHPKLIEAYITLICNYVNPIRAEAKRLSLEQSREGDQKERKRSKSPEREGKKPVRDRSPQRGERASQSDPKMDQTISPSCKLLCGLDLVKCFPIYNEDNPYEGLSLDEDALGSLLLSIDCTAENFRDLDYLFIPIVDGSRGHAILVGLAPKQKYAFYLDSCNPEGPRTRNYWGVALMAIIHRLDPTIKTTALNVPEVDRSKQWYIFGQYSRRTNTIDGSPDGPQQRDETNCGLFTMTSAFCLAFGYSLTCWTQGKYNSNRRDLDFWKKARVVFEMETEDFSAANDFDYDLLEIPQDAIKRLPSSQSEYDSDDNMNEAFGIQKLDFELDYITDDGEEGSDGEDLDIEYDASRAFLTAQEAIDRENPRVQPISDDMTWPAQIPAEPKGYFQRSGFIYPTPDVNFQPELKYSKRELKKACRDFPLVGWQHMSRQSQPLFLQWMLNEMAATISLIRRDAIEPFFELAWGFGERNLECVPR